MVSQKMMRFLKEINIPIRLSCISESDYPIVISLMYIYFDEKFFCATQNNSKIIGYLKRNSKCGFEIAGEDKKFYYAKAEVKHNQVVVYSDSVSNPVAARYGWADDMPEVNLYNKELLPASPFRTDTWKGATEATKYEIKK